MTRSSLAKARKIALSLAILAAPAMAPTAGHAQAGIVFSGNAYACFYPDAGSCVPASLDTYQGLTFDATPPPATDFYGVTDADGFTAFGGQLNNFGLVSLAYPPTFAYGTTNFLLRLGFVSPTTTSTEYTADLKGTVAADDNGVSFTFFDNNHVLSYVDGTGRTVEFTVTANNFSVNANQPATDITGNVQINSVTPEPVSMALLGTGLFGLAGAARRRRRKESDLA